MAKTNKTTTNRAEQTSSAERATLNTASADTWFKSNKTRPKTVVLTLQRTSSGYTVEQATVLKRTNQYGVQPVQVAAKDIVSDINRRGLIA